MSAIEIAAHDIETAIKTGLAQLNLLRAEVKIEVLDEGSKGVLGIGARPARVRLTPYAEIEAAAKSAAPAPAVAPQPQAAAPRPPASAPVVPPESPTTMTPAASATEQSAPPQVDAFEPPETSDLPTEQMEATDLVAEVSSEDQLLASEDAQRLAATLTQGVLDRMNFQVTCNSRLVPPQGREESPTIWVDIQGKDASRLLAHQSEALEALQLVVQTMWAHQTKSSMRVTLDADSYKERREKRIQQMAQRLAERVISSGRSITLEPMPPSERRLVHIALRDHPRVMTESQGEGSSRRVTIRLK